MTQTLKTPPAGAKPAPSPSPAWIAPVLALVAGVVDTTGFIVMGGIFCAHVTGNFVLLGAALHEGGHTLLAAKLTVLPMFVVGVFIGWWLSKRGGRAAMLLAGAEAIMLAAAAGCEVLASFVEPYRGLWWSQLGATVIAMGLHSMLSRSLRLPMTNVMTGNVTQLTIDILEQGQRPEAGAAAVRGLILISAFAAGAIAAGLSVHIVGFRVMLVPAALLVLVAFVAGLGPRGAATTPGGQGRL